MQKKKMQMMRQSNLDIWYKIGAVSEFSTEIASILKKIKPD